MVLFFENTASCCDCKISEHISSEVTFPLRLDEEGAVTLAKVLSVCVVSFACDKVLNENLTGLRAGNLDIFKNADIFGDGYFTVGASLALYLIGGEKERKTALSVVESFVETGLITGVIKLGFGRRRPDSGFDAFAFEPFGLKNDSFPSGHTAVAFSTAAVLAKAYNIGLITYPLAACAGFARIYKEKHWLSDVFLGAVIGTIIGNIHETANEKTVKTYLEYNGTEMSFIIRNKF